MANSTAARLKRIAWVCLLLCAGCTAEDHQLHYLGDAALTHYTDIATQIDYPNVESDLNPELSMSQAPRQLGNLTHDEVWELSLAEAIQIALTNNEIIRRNGGIVDTFDSAQSIYDSAIQETQPLFGVGSTNSRGIEDALSDFDAQFSTNMLWGRSAEVSNSFFSGGGLQNGLTLTNETGAFESRLQKTLANSGIFALQHDWDYSGSNTPSRLFPSVYTGFIRAEYRQPLLAGSGTEFTRIAGPRDQRVGVNRGVLIARINQDLTLADFEARVTDLLKEVEDSYWDLYLNYQVFHNEVLARNSAKRRWIEIENLRESGLRGSGILSAEAQSRGNYFDARARTENALADIYAAETALRRLLGLPTNEGKVIRPKDEPVMVPVGTDWNSALAEALTQRVELRQQKWRIKELELELRAARNLARPTLDFVSNYQVNGFGDDLLRYNDADSAGTGQGFASAYESITQGEQTGWNLGFEFSWRMGLRSELAQIRNIELRLAKARAFLAAKELDIGHELSLAVQQKARYLQVSQTYLNREIAISEQVNRLEVEKDAPGMTASPEAVDLRLRADINLRDARIAYFSSLISYNKALAELEYRKGTLLTYDNVHLAEAMWTPEAYEDAMRRAWARTHALDAHHVHAEPEVIVQDPMLTMPVQGGVWESSEISNGFPVPPAPPVGGEDLPPAAYAPGVEEDFEYDLNAVPPAPAAELPELEIPDISMSDEQSTFVGQASVSDIRPGRGSQYIQVSAEPSSVPSGKMGINVAPTDATTQSPSGEEPGPPIVIRPANGRSGSDPLWWNKTP